MPWAWRVALTGVVLVATVNQVDVSAFLAHLFVGVHCYGGAPKLMYAGFIERSPAYPSPSIALITGRVEVCAFSPTPI